jgi:hypothetical protein
VFSFLPCQIAIITAKTGPKIPNIIARVVLRSSSPLCFGGALLDAVGAEDVLEVEEVVIVNLEFVVDGGGDTLLEDEDL